MPAPPLVFFSSFFSIDSLVARFPPSNLVGAKGNQLGPHRGVGVLKTSRKSVILAKIKLPVLPQMDVDLFGEESGNSKLSGALGRVLFPNYSFRARIVILYIDSGAGIVLWRLPGYTYL